MKIGKGSTLCAGVLLLAALGVLAPTAQADDHVAADEGMPATSAADWHYIYTADEGDTGGRASIQFDGDEVEIRDGQDDGKDVQLDVWNVSNDPDTHEYRLRTKTGYGGTETVSAADGQPWNLAEGDCFRFRIRLVEPETKDDVVPGSTYSEQVRNHNSGGARQCSGVE